jgi:hypothetical protein
MFFVLFVLNFPTILVAAAAKYYGPLSAGRNSTGYQAIWDGPGGFNLGSTTLGRGLHSSTCQLNVSAFGGTRGRDKGYLWGG